MSIRNKLDEKFFELHEQRLNLNDYAYVMNPVDFARFREEAMICMDFTVKAPIYNNLPIYLDETVTKGDIILKRLEFIDENNR